MALEHPSSKQQNVEENLRTKNLRTNALCTPKSAQKSAHKNRFENPIGSQKKTHKKISAKLVRNPSLRPIWQVLSLGGVALSVMICLGCKDTYRNGEAAAAYEDPLQHV